MEQRIVDKLFIATKAFIIHENKVLVLREDVKSPDGTNPHSFDLPGGRLEPGEDVYTGLHRKVKEETGLEVKISDPFYVGEWWPKVRGEQWHIVGIYFLCSLQGNNEVVLNHEHDHAEWIEPKQYEVIDLIENVAPAFVTYLKSNQ